MALVPGMPQFTRTLLDLPDEILYLIISEVIGSKYEDIEISVQRRIPGYTYGRKWRQGQEPNFHCFRTNNLMRCSRKAKELVLASFEAYNTFLSSNTEGFQRLPKLLRPGYIPFIRKLCMRMDNFTMTHDELVFPGVLSVLCEYLTDLRDFTLESDVLKGDLGSSFLDARDRKHSCKISRQQQEIRALVRLMSYVVLRHPLLSRMILPGDSGMASEPVDDYCLIRYFLVADVGQDRRWNCQDQALNATTLSLITWSDLAVTNLSDHAIEPPIGASKADIVNSCIPHVTGYFAPVFEQAYCTQQLREWRCWQNHGVDHLIRKCRGTETLMLSRDHQAEIARNNINWHVNDDPFDKLSRSRKRHRKRKSHSWHVQISGEVGSDNWGSDTIEPDNAGFW